MKKEEITKNPDDSRGSHVVLLGAGASLAAFPNGDANQNQLPIMNDLVEVVGLTPLLEKNNIDTSGNFEKIYSTLKDKVLINEIEKKVFHYFNSMSLPTPVTIYDKLLLSLRNKDAIFTFNWDPFLFDAYKRNCHVASMPHIYFLHGNVRIGACENCDNWGEKFNICPTCGKRYKDVPLLYPIEKKNYFGENRYTTTAWKSANSWFADAFTITIFGYGAPSSDQEAVELLTKAWFQKSPRQFEYVEVIDVLSETQLAERWEKFTPTYHFLSASSFEKSRLWQSPRRSCESLFYPMTQGLPCETFPLTEINNLSELQNAIRLISQYEY